MDLRVQIKTHNIEGFFIMFNDERYEILPDGQIPNWPNGLFEEIPDFLEKLLDWENGN